jgi:biopolymer transport protein TolQ
MLAVHFLASLGTQDLLGLLEDTTLFGKVILLILLVISVMSWAVLIEKARLLASFRQGHLKFWDRCDAWLEGRLDRTELHSWCQANTRLPLCNMFLETEGMRGTAAIRRAAERVAYAEVEAMERYLILLATAVTIAPFLGLLGTVWGIMTSFWDMSSMRSANLTVVAPGIAEALITTIAGLATAIPAVVFYNMLVRKIDLIGNEMERLRTILEEEHSRLGNDRTEAEAREMLDPVRRPAIHDKERI